MVTTKTAEPKPRETVDERIDRLVAEAPPLSDEVCARLRQLLQSVVTR